MTRYLALAVLFGIWTIHSPAIRPASAGDAEKISGGMPIVSLPAHDLIYKALSEPAEVEFIEVLLNDVVDFFKQKHHIEIQLDRKSLEEAGIATNTPMTHVLKGISLRSALRVMLRDLDLTYVIRDEVLLITTKEQASQLLEIRVYPVSDLLRELGADPATVEPDYESLVDTITSCLTPYAWVDVGGSGAIKRISTTSCLVINQTQEVHEQIDALFSTLRQARAKQQAE